MLFTKDTQAQMKRMQHQASKIPTVNEQVVKLLELTKNEPCVATKIDYKPLNTDKSNNPPILFSFLLADGSRWRAKIGKTLSLQKTEFFSTPYSFSFDKFQGHLEASRKAVLTQQFGFEPMYSQTESLLNSVIAEITETKKAIKLLNSTPIAQTRLKKFLKNELSTNFYNASHLFEPMRTLKSFKIETQIN